MCLRHQQRLNRLAPTSTEIRAAVVTHHLLADQMIIDLGKKLAVNKNISRLVIIGPNHDEVGDRHLLTDDQNLAKLYPLLEYTPKLVNNDHACYAPRGVLKKYLTEVPFSCVLVSSRVSPEESAVMATTLQKYLGGSGVLVASVDFSHYLPLIQAEQNDLITQKYLTSFNASPLMKLGNHYLDSPHTLDILFKYLKLINSSRFDIVDHLNSAQILDSPDLPSTTSYFEIVYY